LRSGERPHASKVSAVSVSADTSAAQAFQQIVDSVVSHMMANMAAAELADAEAVHQFRVAIRRMRAALVLFNPRLHRETTFKGLVANSPHGTQRALRAACSSIRARIDFWDGTLTNIRSNPA
jgi:inorganic triphosphatase YgiF